MTTHVTKRVEFVVITGHDTVLTEPGLRKSGFLAEPTLAGHQPGATL